MAETTQTKKKTREEIEEEIDEELEDEWEDDGQKSAGAILLRTFGEVRNRFLIILGTLVFFSCVAGYWCNQIFDFLMRPLCKAFEDNGGAPILPGDLIKAGVDANVRSYGNCKVYPVDLMEPMVVLFKMSLLIGVLCTLPVIFYQGWMFAKRWIPVPMHKWVLAFVTTATLMFLGGATTGYYLVFPRAFGWLLSFGGKHITVMPTMESYYEMIALLLLGFGIITELPLLMLITSKIGLTNSALFNRYQRQIIFGLMLLATVLCPSTDPVTYLSMAIPLVLLFEVGVLGSKLVEAKGPTILQQRITAMKGLLDEGEEDEDDDDEDDDDDDDGGLPEPAGA